jgi:hypothetical protein
VVVPFVPVRPDERIAIQVEATGAGSVLVDRVRLEPDVRAFFRQRAQALSDLDPTLR